MRIFTYKTTQHLKTDIDTAWNFFSDPRNLIKITPEWLGFKITCSLPAKMFPGMLITYKVNPLLKIPLTWVTQINSIEEKCCFIDEQKFGPYKLWHHKHTFKVTPTGIEMTDEVTYALYFGIFSPLVNKLIVSKKIDEIFSFRKNVLGQLF
ncbi:MAG: SRPBCC family protein [Ignavibacteriales bacterium]|nr:MAG: SRPBCC family protein [Ignavibacteriales bacterium]